MNSLLHRDGEDALDERHGRADREIHLGTTMILGIFFALAVLCAVFFGFGYATGRKSVVPSAVLSPGAQSGTFAGFKPAAGSTVENSPVQSAGPGVTVPYETPTATPKTVTPPPAVAAEREIGEDVSSVETPATSTSASRAVSATPVPAADVPSVSGSGGGGSAIVQIAAVSHQEDADLLVTTLKRRGYAVAVRNEPQDKLLHVQVGPFSSHKDADAMRQKLLADGFNAIVKDSK